MKFPIALAAGIGGGIAALVPGGKSPKEGFMDAFNAVMNFGSGESKPTIPTEETADGEKLTDGADDATADAEKEETGGTDSTGSGISNEVYPFKLSGFDRFDDRTIKHDEYTILGKDKKGRFQVKDPNGRQLTVTNPKAATFIENAVEGKRTDLANMHMDNMAGGSDLFVDEVTSGADLTSREAELAQKRAGYHDGGQGRFNISTNVGGTNSSTTNSVVVTKEEPSFFQRVSQNWFGGTPN